MNFELTEKSLLGTMLNENYLILDSDIKAAYFQTHLHKRIFDCMKTLAQQGKAVDYITLLTMTDPKEIGGANYLADLNRFANPVLFDQHKKLLIDQWRELEKSKLLTRAQMENWTIEEVQRALDSLQDAHNDSDDTSLTSYLVSQYERPFYPSEKSRDITTGLQDLDSMLDGFQNNEFTVIAGRPSMGKTDILNHFALHAGWNGHLPIIFSLEMSHEQMGDRLIAVTGEYSRLKMRDPYIFMDEKQKEDWTTTLTRLNAAKIHIDDRSALTVNVIKAKARTIIRANPDKRPIIFIDYLQIIKPESQSYNQTYVIGEISSELKRMAKEFGCPVVVLSQLSRRVEQRDDKRPIMSDLRDSGNIEQDADVVAFLYREDYYDKETALNGVLEISIAKNRNGPTGNICVKYCKETGNLNDMTG